MENIVSLFLSAAAKYPDRVALIEGNRSISYRELEQQVRQTAAHLQAKGLAAGDRILIFVPMSIDLYRVVLATFYIGATAVFLDEWVSRKRLAVCCEIAQCKGFVGIPKARFYAFFLRSLRKIPVKLGTSLAGTASAQGPANVAASDAALITFTTGSTGTPKAAKRTHAFLHAQFAALLDKINPQPSDIDLPTLPIVLFVNLGVGCTSVIARIKVGNLSSADARKVVALLQKHCVNRMIASPYFVKCVAESVRYTKAALPHLRQVFTGGAPVFPREAATLIAAFPAVEIEVVYGSTEAEPISSINANELAALQEEALSTGLRVGNVYHGTALRIIHIVDEPIACRSENELNAITLPSGALGEIIVAGAHVLREYFNNETAFRQNKIVVGETVWHRTGDSGFQTTDGTLFLTGRCAQLLHREGKTIAPFLCENVLMSIAGITIGTVIEVNAEVTAVVETKLPASKVSEMLTDTMLHGFPVRVVKTIPRDPRHHSKIDYGALKKSALA